MTAAPVYPRPSFPRLSMEAPAPTSSTTTGPLRYVEAVNGSSLDRTQKLILLALLEWLNFETWKTFVGTTALAEACGVHYDTVRDTVRGLHELGVLATVLEASGRRAATIVVSLDRLDQLRRPPKTKDASAPQAAPAPAVGSVPHRPYEADPSRRVGPTPTLAEPVGSVPHRPYAVGSESSPRRVGPTPTKQTEQREEEEDDRGREAATPAAPSAPSPPAPPTPAAIAYRVLAAAWPRDMGANDRRALADRAAQLAAMAGAIVGIDVEGALQLALDQARNAKGGDVGRFNSFRVLVSYLATCLESWAREGLPLEFTDVSPRKPAGRDRAAPAPAAPHAQADRPLDAGPDASARGAATAAGGTRRPGKHLPGSRGYRADDPGAVRGGGAGGREVGGPGPVPPAGRPDGRGG